MLELGDHSPVSPSLSSAVQPRAAASSSAEMVCVPIAPVWWTTLVGLLPKSLVGCRGSCRRPPP